VLSLPNLVGNRVKLEPLRRAHIEGLFAAGQHAEIWPHMFMRVTTMEDMAEVVDKALTNMQAGVEFAYTTIDVSTNRIVGSTRLYEYMPAHRQLEIGSTWLTPDVWRTHVNTECKYLLLTHCFETMDLVRVQLKTDARNVRSQRAIERLGAMREGILRKHRIVQDGFIRDTVMYSIIEEEWPAVKLRLEAMMAQ